VGWLEIYGGIGLILLAIARFVPLSRLPFWGCALRKLTGFPCLSCGMTRSFDWFMHGRFLDSLLINPLGFLLAVLSIVGLLYLLLRRWRPPRLAVDLTARQSFWVRVICVALLAGNWAFVIARAVAHRT
jgi:nitrate reductase gamma subunit